MFSKRSSRHWRHKLEVGPIETTTIGGEIIFIAPKTAAAGGCGPPLIFVKHTGGGLLGLPLISAATQPSLVSPSNIEHELSREVPLRAA